MPGGGLRGQHAGRFAKAKSNMALTLKEADSVAPYIPPTSVPREGKRMRGMRRTNQWYHPSKLINCGKLDSVQTETKSYVMASAIVAIYVGSGPFLRLRACKSTRHRRPARHRCGAWNVSGQRNNIGRCLRRYRQAPRPLPTQALPTRAP